MGTFHSSVGVLDQSVPHLSDTNVCHTRALHCCYLNPIATVLPNLVQMPALSSFEIVMDIYFLALNGLESCFFQAWHLHPLQSIYNLHPKHKYSPRASSSAHGQKKRLFPLLTRSECNFCNTAKAFLDIYWNVCNT